MLKKSPSGVLASLRAQRTDGQELPELLGVGRVRRDTPRPLRHGALTGSRPSADVTLIILRVADLAAALLDGHFEHPDAVTPSQPFDKISAALRV
jgi:hypothetical protein